MTQVTILDYGVGNLFSVAHALKRADHSMKVRISSTVDGKVEGVILPGVGTYASCQGMLSKDRDGILKLAQDKKVPILGICLGMQLLFERSEEGEGKGLGLFEGRVTKFRKRNSVKVPHIGWNTISITCQPRGRLCKGIRSGAWVYYIHSFFAKTADKQLVKAQTKYSDIYFPAVIERQNLFGTQFHPEKSGQVGADIISNFLSICTGRDGGSGA